MNINSSQKTIAGILLFSFLFSSCTQRIYFPDKAVAPGLTEQLETKLYLSARPHTSATGTIDTASKLKFSPSVDLAFSPIKHIGVFASYKTLLNKTFRERDISDPWDYNNSFGGTFNGRQMDFGIGYYDKISAKGKFEVYFGYGFGNLKRTGNLLKQYDFTTDYNRFFIQPAFGFDFKYFSLMAGLKVAAQRHSNFNAPLFPDLKYKLANRERNIEKETFVLVEPFINMEAGFQYVKFNVQFGLGMNLWGSGIYGNYPQAYCSFGIVGHLKPSFLKDKKR